MDKMDFIRYFNDGVYSERPEYFELDLENVINNYENTIEDLEDEMTRMDEEIYDLKERIKELQGFSDDFED